MFFFLPEKHVLGMASMRIISGLIEIMAALLMLKFNRVEDALRINAVLALIGPTVLLLVTSLGLWGMAGRASPAKLAFILLGVALIFYGTRKI
ncbi:MAG: hypothetical protein PWP65_2024 [Clostridia bacterium]|nr:hypothetical protein [Clostridia bacterium]